MGRRAGEEGKPPHRKKKMEIQLKALRLFHLKSFSN
jgi:hypothetical protein